MSTCPKPDGAEPVCYHPALTIFQPGGTQIRTVAARQWVLLCACPALSSIHGASKLISPWGVQRGSQCPVVFRVMLSTHLWDGTMGGCRSPGPTTIKRVARTCEGQSLTHLFYGQTAACRRSGNFINSTSTLGAQGPQTHSSPHGAQPMCRAVWTFSTGISWKGQYLCFWLCSIASVVSDLLQDERYVPSWCRREPVSAQRSKHIPRAAGHETPRASQCSSAAPREDPGLQLRVPERRLQTSGEPVSVILTRTVVAAQRTFPCANGAVVGPRESRTIGGQIPVQHHRLWHFPGVAGPTGSVSDEDLRGEMVHNNRRSASPTAKRGCRSPVHGHRHQPWWVRGRPGPSFPGSGRGHLERGAEPSHQPGICIHLQPYV